MWIIGFEDVLLYFSSPSKSGPFLLFRANPSLNLQSLSLNPPLFPSFLSSLSPLSLFPLSSYLLCTQPSLLFFDCSGTKTTEDPSVNHHSTQFWGWDFNVTLESGLKQRLQLGHILGKQNLFNAETNTMWTKFILKL